MRKTTTPVDNCSHRLPWNPGLYLLRKPDREEQSPIGLVLADEAVVEAWRNVVEHRISQGKGRTTSLPITGCGSTA